MYSLIKHTAFRWIWTLFLGLLAVVLAWRALQPLPMLTSELFKIVPENQALSTGSRAALKQINNTALMILVSAGDDSKTLALVSTLAERFKKMPELSHISYEVNAENMSHLKAVYDPIKNSVLSPEDRTDLKNGQGLWVKDQALQLAVSPFSVGAGYTLVEDPFFLSTKFLMQLPFPNKNITPEYGRLSLREKDRLFGMIMLELDPKLGMDALQTTIARIEAQIKGYTSEKTGIEIIMTGIPRHSAYGAQTAKTEISLFSTLSMIGLVLLILGVFRSIYPLLISVAIMAVAIFVAFGVSLLIFGQLHVLTLVFGCSLIGISVDYSFHYMTYLYTEEPRNNSILSKIIVPLSMAVVTSAIEYGAMLLTPFPILNQMAVFSIVGLVASFMAVIVYLPLLPEHKFKGKKLHLKCPQYVVLLWTGHKKKAYAALGLCAGIGLLGLLFVQADDNIRLLYTPSKALIHDETRMRTLIGNPIAVPLLIVRGENTEDLLEKEESLTDQLDLWVKEKKLGNYYALSRFLPSNQRLSENRTLIQTALETPYYEAYAKDLGLPSERVESSVPPIKKETQLRALQEINPLLKRMWLPLKSETLSIVFLQDPEPVIPEMKQWAENNKTKVTFVDQVSYISNTFKYHRVQLATLLVVAYGLVFGLLALRYRYKIALILLIPTVAGSLLSIGILGFLGIPLTLFHILALFILLGSGVDYALFFQEGKEHLGVTGHSVFLSCISTLLSFGILALSQTAAIKAFGCVIFVGMLSIYILSPLCLGVNQNESH